MQVLAFIATHMTKILGTAQTVVAAILGAAAAKQIPDLVAVDSPAFQWFVLLNILLGGATIARGFNNSAQIKVATAIDNALQATPAPKQGGFARVGLLGFIATAVIAAGMLNGCATDQFARHETTARLVTQYAVLKYAEQIPEAQRDERIGRIRAIATDVKGLAAGETTLELLRAAVNAQLDKAGLSAADRLLADGLVQILAAASRRLISVSKAVL